VELASTLAVTASAWALMYASLQAVQASAQESPAELEEVELVGEVCAEAAAAVVEEPEREVAATRTGEALPVKMDVPAIPVEVLTAEALTDDAEEPDDAPSELMTGLGPGKV